MPTHDTEWTAEMVRALPEDGKRYEVLDGELFVSPAPSFQHQALVLELARRLQDYVRLHSLGWVKISPADIQFPRYVLQPDVFVIPDVGTGHPKSWHDVKTLLLAAEVISPSTARADRFDKRTAYQNHRVPEYWIVDSDANLFERWRPDDGRPEILSDSITWQPRDGIPPLEIQLPEFFAAALQ